ncbi:MAG: type transport system ATP-binding protein [Solirubrobacteraceae bacterium]|nr:type transport system ATP-binding protein [Solirubrobacteraceae bacterium]
MRRGIFAGLVAAALLPALPSTAHADLAQLKGACTPQNASPVPATPMPFRFCDDGVPTAGGTTPNPTVAAAVAVPAKYAGVVGLPPQAPDAASVPGADPAGRVALDVDVTLPDATRYPPPAGGWPLLVLMHGCCSGSKSSWERSSIEPSDSEGWHYSNAWFASRGYVVLTYTARGFVTSDSTGRRGSTGQAQLDDVRYEINDFQHLAGQLADDPFFHVDPQRVVVTGGSYGGGFSWLAMTDPVWKSPGGRDMRIVAAAPKYGWTDLAYSLVPNGAHRRDALPAFDGASTSNPVGFPKQSINAALYGSGKTGIPPGTGAHTTFPMEIDQAQACLTSSDPFESNPLCQTTLSTTLPEFLKFRSAYYQDAFWNGLAAGTIAPVPVFSAGTFTDPLFPSIEHRRMAERLKSVRADYPIQEYYGDYQHFTQNKAREWGDVCGADRHVCKVADHPGANLNADPAGLVRRGITTRINRFVDHYARPQGDPGQPVPGQDVVAALQVCDENAAQFGVAPQDAGPQIAAPSFGALAPGTLRVEAAGSQSTTSRATPNSHAVRADPVANQAGNSSKCVVESAPGGSASAGAGVATYDSPPLASDSTLLGQTRVTVAHTGSGAGVQLNARLYDLDPAAGRQILVDRGPYRPAQAAGTSTWDLHGNGWRFPRGHRIRIELAQDDSPFVKSSTQPSSLTISRVLLQLPVREASRTVTGASAPFRQRTILRAPRLASDYSATTSFVVGAFPRGARAADLSGYQLQVRRSARGPYRWLRRSVAAGRLGRAAVRFKGLPGRTYWFRARAVSRSGNPGPWARAVVVVPHDDSLAASPARYSGRWARVRSRAAFIGRYSRSSTPGSAVTMTFRGDRLYVIGRRGPGGGTAAVLVDGRRVGILRANARRARWRSVLLSRAVSVRRRHRLTVVVLSGRVELDAFGFRAPARVGV